MSDIMQDLLEIIERIDKLYEDVSTILRKVGITGIITERDEQFVKNIDRVLDQIEPRVLMVLEIKPCLPYWLEFSDGELRPVICYDAEWDAKEPYITFVWQYGTSSYKTERYGLEWRCWSAKPTDIQRGEMKWLIKRIS